MIRPFFTFFHNISRISHYISFFCLEQECFFQLPKRFATFWSSEIWFIYIFNVLLIRESTHLEEIKWEYNNWKILLSRDLILEVEVPAKIRQGKPGFCTLTASSLPWLYCCQSATATDGLPTPLAIIHIPASDRFRTQVLESGRRDILHSTIWAMFSFTFQNSKWHFLI